MANHGVSGIIDWGDAAISDPAVDFVGLFTWYGENHTGSRPWSPPMDQSRARSIAVDLCGLNLINQSLILDVSRLFANSVTFQHNSDN